MGYKESSDYLNESSPSILRAIVRWVIRLALPILALVLVISLAAYTFTEHQRSRVFVDHNRIVIGADRVTRIVFIFKNVQYVVSSNGSGEVGDILPPGLGDDARWSPDGQWITFSLSSNGEYEIFIMRSDGSQRIRVPFSKGGTLPVWSPDGTHIAYQQFHKKDDNDPYGTTKIIVNDVRCLVQGQNCTPPSYSLNWFMPVTNPNLAPSRAQSPDWSPDGSQIVFAGSYRDQHIYVIDAAGQGPAVDLTPNVIDILLSPRWSPDGRKIVFVCKAGNFIGGDICIMNRDGSNRIQLTHNTFSGNPEWSPDGRKIAFSSDMGENLGKALGPFCGACTATGVFIMNPDGTNVVRLTFRNDEIIHWIAWHP